MKKSFSPVCFLHVRANVSIGFCSSVPNVHQGSFIFWNIYSFPVAKIPYAILQPVRGGSRGGRADIL